VLRFLKTYSYKDKRLLLSHLDGKGHKKPKTWKKIHSEVCGADEMNYDIKPLLKELSDKKGYSLIDKDKFFIKVVSNPNEASKLDKGEFKVRYRYDLAFDKAGQKKIQHNTREFCEVLINRNLIYRREDINFMSLQGANPIAKQNYSIFRLKGHWNCRHAWRREVYVQIKDDKTVANNPIYGKPKLALTENKKIKIKKSLEMEKNVKIKMAIASFSEKMAGQPLTKKDIILVNEMLLGKQMFVDAKVDDKILRIDADEIEVGAAVSWIDEAGELMEVEDGEYTLTDEGKVIAVASGVIETVTDIEEEAAEEEATEETELAQNDKFAALETKINATLTAAISKLTKELSGKFTAIEKTVKDIPAFEKEEIKSNFSNELNGSKRVSLNTPFARKEA